MTILYSALKASWGLNLQHLPIDE